MSEVSGSTPLTQRLIEAGKRADSKARNTAMFKASDSVSIQDGAVRAVAVAMLLDLAEGLTKSRRPSITVAGLLALADSIERGE